jgi:hypothetical protein
MNQSIWLALALAFSCSISLASPLPKFGEKTGNARQYVLSHSDFPEGGITQFDCSKCSAMTNLIFVAPTKECGNAGCGFFIFKEQNKSYEFVTIHFLHPGAFQFLKSKHLGMNDLLFYNHMSAMEGTLTTFEFDGKNYQQVGKSEAIKSADLDRRLKPEPVKPAYFF